MLKHMLFVCANIACVIAASPKIIIDNDWNSEAFVTFLIARDAGWDILGLIGDTGDTWALQASLHALALLEIGNLSCIPVYKGASYPLLNTPEMFQTWQLIHGALPYAGAFRPYNATAEASGSDPSSGDPDRVSRSAFLEGYPNGTLAGDKAAAWMVEQVNRYPGEVMIYSGGALTNSALAVRMDPKFASLTKGLVVMGGILDANLLQTSGSRQQADDNSDFNIKMDPEAAKITLTADFPNITIVGNAANQVFPTQAYLDEVYEVRTPYTKLFNELYGTQLPFWDETTMFAALYPEHVTNKTSIYIDVDIAWSSPYYGNVTAHQQMFVPSIQSLRNVSFIYEVDGAALKQTMKRAMQYVEILPYCRAVSVNANYCPTYLQMVQSRLDVLYWLAAGIRNWPGVLD